MAGGAEASEELFSPAPGCSPPELSLSISLSCSSSRRERAGTGAFLVLCVLPPTAAVAGFLGKRDIRPGLAVAALALAILPLPLTGGLEILLA